MTLYTHHGSEESLPSDLRSLLQIQDTTELCRFVYFREVDSTNTTARELARRGYPHATVVIADQQREGRGRRGRQWFSPEGKNIYMSLIFRDTVGIAYPELITIYAAVCVVNTICNLIDKAETHVWAKWPNDIYWDDRKLGGILTEGVFSSGKERFFVIGIGLNMNSSEEELLKNTEGRGTSLYVETGNQYGRDRFIREIAYSLLNSTVLLETPQRLRDNWRAISRTPGAKVLVMGDKGAYKAMAMGINERGHLVVRDEADGVVRVLSAEEVVHLR